MRLEKRVEVVCMPEVEMTERYERRRIVDPKSCMPCSFRTDDIGRIGHSKRVACINKTTKKYITQSMLISHDEPIEMKRKLRKEVSQMKSRYKRKLR
jgi:hypothetical protein